MLFFPLQCRVHLDKSAGGGGWTLRIRAGRFRPGSAGNQCCIRGAPSDCGCGGYCWPRGHSYKLQRRKAANALERLLPGRSVGPHICSVQYVSWDMGEPKACQSGAMEPGLRTWIEFIYRKTWPWFFSGIWCYFPKYKFVRWLFWRRDAVIEFPFLLISFSTRIPLSQKKCHIMSVQFLVMI